VCAIALIVWGVVAAAAVAADVWSDSKAGWPHDFTTWWTWSPYLNLGAHVLGVLAILWGLIGLSRRGGLHAGGITALVVAVVLIVSIVIVKANLPTEAHETWGQIAKYYWDSIIWRVDGDSINPAWADFARGLVLPGAAVPFVLWLLVLLTGAGRPAGETAASAPYAAGPAASSYGAFAPGAAAAPAPAGPAAPAPGAEPAAAGAAEPSDAQTAGRPDYAPPAAGPDLPATVVVPDAPEQQSDTPAAPAGPSGDRPVAPRSEVPDEEPVVVDGAARPGRHQAAAPAPAGPAGVTADDVETGAPVPVLPGDSAVWFVTIQGRDHGPYTLTQLRAYLGEGRLHPGTITHLQDQPARPLGDLLA